MEECVVKTFPSHFFFHLDHTDLLMEEPHIGTRDPSDFQEIQLICKIFFQLSWIYLTIKILFQPSSIFTGYLDHPQEFLLNFHSTIRIFPSISIFYSSACPSDFFFRMGCTDKKWNDPRQTGSITAAQLL